ncbi:hypothetical protein INS49_011478 [Diaporthe citri]|uniref:uncharacterized protein n=1 Tax=Diaporthe citri TaxID=83186 RepID=UPI001C7E3D53|nr:uncharacterized protein INS49_011478 [Diaporthe citri]KAG6360418.1 hypothetical protein INS49_011478 [Diaporthe citri]
MSYRGISNLPKLPQEDIWVPKKLSSSRSAPSGMEDQAMAISTPSDEKTTTPATNGLASSRWAAVPAEPSQVGNKKAAKADQENKNKKNHQMKPRNSTLNQPRPDNKTRGTPAITTPATARRIIGPLSAEEKEVKMENPFFDPTKHKGLGSSRWANE